MGRIAPRKARLVGFVLAVLWLPLAPAADEPGVLHGDALLWRVGNGEAPAGYLFGTMHTDDPRVMKLPDKVSRAFQASEELAVEMQLTPDVFGGVMKLMMRGDATTLRGAIGAEAFEKVQPALARRGINESVANRFKTWAAMMTLIAPPNPSGTFLDRKLQDMAGKRGMAVHSLESPREQLGAFDNLSAGEQRRLLDMALELVPDLDALYEQITAAYLKEDLSRILRLSRRSYTPEDKALHEKLMRLLVDRRNHTMVENMKPLLEEGGVFVAVGALHLPGGEGIVNLLKQQGYSVEPVR